MQAYITRLIKSRGLIFGEVRRKVEELLRWRGLGCVFLLREGGLDIRDGPSGIFKYDEDSLVDAGEFGFFVDCLGGGLYS